jgi:hypothetical protein
MLTLAEQLGQHPFHLPECCDFLADDCESVACYFADGAPTSPLFEPHEFANLIETEAKVLRALDEPNPINRGGRVAPHAAGSMWDSQQTTSLVVPYHFDRTSAARASFPIVTAAASEWNGTVAGTRLTAVLGMT